MGGLVRYQAGGLQRLVDALGGAIEVESDPAFVAMREASERRLLLEVLRMPPWWQAEPERYWSELESARPLLETADVQMEVRHGKDGAVVLEGELTLADGERRAARMVLPRSFPEQAPEVHLRASAKEWLVLPLPLEKVWRPDMDSGFVLRAAADLINEGLRQASKGGT